MFMFQVATLLWATGYLSLWHDKFALLFQIYLQYAEICMKSWLLQFKDEAIYHHLTITHYMQENSSRVYCCLSNPVFKPHTHCSNQEARAHVVKHFVFSSWLVSKDIEMISWVLMGVFPTDDEECLLNYRWNHENILESPTTFHCSLLKVVKIRSWNASECSPEG